jgi:hypothetical protein
MNPSDHQADAVLARSQTNAGRAGAHFSTLQEYERAGQTGRDFQAHPGLLPLLDQDLFEELDEVRWEEVGIGRRLEVGAKDSLDGAARLARVTAYPSGRPRSPGAQVGAVASSA